MEINKAWFAKRSVPGERIVRAHRRLFTHPWGIKMAIWIYLFVRVRWTTLDAIISSPQISMLNTVKVHYSLMQVKWLVWQFSSQCWLSKLAFFPITIPLILHVASMPKSENWAIVYVFDVLMARPGSGTYYHCPHPFWSQPNTKGDWEMLSRVQERDMELVSISLVCLKS